MIEKECDFRAEEKYHLIEAYAEMMLDRISPCSGAVLWSKTTLTIWMSETSRCTHWENELDTERDMPKDTRLDWEKEGFEWNHKDRNREGESLACPQSDAARNARARIGRSTRRRTLAFEWSKGICFAVDARQSTRSNSSM